MIRFLRRHRQHLLLARKFRNYVLYAVGEVLLVVIGILIALQINTWNEERKTVREFRNILSIIRQDLAQDTAEMAAIIRIYNDRKPIYRRVLTDSATEQDYRSGAYATLIMNYASVVVDTRGYTLLRDFKGTNTSEYDSLESDLVTFYSYMVDRLEEDRTKVTNDYLKNVEYWKEHQALFTNVLTRGELSGENLNYYYSDDYRSRVAFHHSLVYNNYLPRLLSFNELAVELLQAIDEQL